jgi:hypothetical protein
LYPKEKTPNFTKTTIRRNLVFLFTTSACSSMRHSIGAVHFWKLRSLLTAAAAHMIINPSFKNQGNRHLPSIWTNNFFNVFYQNFERINMTRR